jgi:hypothetical protein
MIEPDAVHLLSFTHVKQIGIFTTENNCSPRYVRQSFFWDVFADAIELLSLIHNMNYTDPEISNKANELEDSIQALVGTKVLTEEKVNDVHSVRIDT